MEFAAVANDKFVKSPRISFPCPGDQFGVFVYEMGADMLSAEYPKKGSRYKGKSYARPPLPSNQRMYATLTVVYPPGVG